MDLEEAKRIAEVIGFADDSCACCVVNLCNDLNIAFPAFTWSRSIEYADIPEWKREDWMDDSDRPLLVTVTAALPNNIEGEKSVG